MRNRKFNRLAATYRMFYDWRKPTLAKLGIDVWTWMQRKAYTALQQSTRRTTQEEAAYKDLRVQARKYRKLRRKTARLTGVQQRPDRGMAVAMYVYLGTLKRICFSW